MMKKLVVLSAAAMSVAFAAPAQAQWVGFTADNNGAEYWDNTSSDGTSCNVGFVVTGVAGSSVPTSCDAQRAPGAYAVGVWATWPGVEEPVLVSLRTIDVR